MFVFPVRVNRLIGILDCSIRVFVLSENIYLFGTVDDIFEYKRGHLS